MCLEERNTESRGRAAVPLTFLRIEALRRSRASTLVLAICLSLRSALGGAGLSNFATNGLLDGLDAFALVGLVRPDGANLRRRVAQHLPAAAIHADPVLVHFLAEPFGV